MPRKASKKGSRRAAEKPPPAATDEELQSYKDWREGLSETAERVEHIREMMRRNEWRMGISDHELAKKWDLSPVRVRNLAAEASRSNQLLLAMNPDLKEVLKADFLQFFYNVRHEARELNDAQGLHVAIRANDAIGKYMGFEPPKQIQIATGEFDNLSEQELREYIKGEPPDRRAVKRTNGRSNGHK